VLLQGLANQAELVGRDVRQAKLDYAEVARAIAGFEPVVLICQPGDATDVVNHCGSSVQVTEIEIDDSSTRDSGPVFVVNGGGDVARWTSASTPGAASTCRMTGTPLSGQRSRTCLASGATRRRSCSKVTTEGPVLDRARHPSASRDRSERVAADYLGVDRVVWLVAFPDRDTDRHIDGIARSSGPVRSCCSCPLHQITPTTASPART
jgi:agmatine deiminase